MKWIQKLINSLSKTTETYTQKAASGVEKLKKKETAYTQKRKERKNRLQQFYGRYFGTIFYKSGISKNKLLMSATIVLIVCYPLLYSIPYLAMHSTDAKIIQGLLNVFKALSEMRYFGFVLLAYLLCDIQLHANENDNFFKMEQLWIGTTIVGEIIYDLSLFQKINFQEQSQAAAFLLALETVRRLQLSKDAFKESISAVQALIQWGIVVISIIVLNILNAEQGFYIYGCILLFYFLQKYRIFAVIAILCLSVFEGFIPALIALILILFPKEDDQLSNSKSIFVMVCGCMPAMYFLGGAAKLICGGF